MSPASDQIVPILDCAEFLDRYSEFRDGGLDAEAHARFQEHRRSCLSCARYDRVMARGVGVLQELPAIQPSADFLPRLQHRIYHLEDARVLGRGARASGTSLATLGIAAALALAAWTPWLRLRPDAAPVRVAADSAIEEYHRVRSGLGLASAVTPIAIHGPLAPAMRGSGAELLLWSPAWSSPVPIQTAFLGGPAAP